MFTLNNVIILFIRKEICILKKTPQSSESLFVLEDYCKASNGYWMMSKLSHDLKSNNKPCMQLILFIVLFMYLADMFIQKLTSLHLSSASWSVYRESPYRRTYSGAGQGLHGNLFFCKGPVIGSGQMSGAAERKNKIQCLCQGQISFLFLWIFLHDPLRHGIAQFCYIK